MPLLANWQLNHKLKLAMLLLLKFHRLPEFCKCDVYMQCYSSFGAQVF